MNMNEQARGQIKSRSILWLPSKTWFEFLARRLEALQQSYKELCRKKAKNHGILTGLWAYLMQSVMFTPTMVNPYVTKSLALLRFRTMVDRFGMFFLHDLNLKQKNVLEGVMEVDDLAVMRLLGASEKKTIGRGKRTMPKTSMDDGYPLGKRPSWAQVKECITTQPWTMMQTWRWPEELEETVSGAPGSTARLAGEMFALFTTHMWTVLNTNWLTDREAMKVGTAREALSLWTLSSMDGRIRKCVFTACNGGLTGAIPGKRDEKFEDRVGLYFPEQRSEVKRPWKTMAQRPGYLGEFWNKVSEALPEEKQEDVRRWLRELLKYCQCLPASTHSHPWRAKGDGLLVVTNPIYYKLESVGASGSRRMGGRLPVYLGARAQKVRMLELQGYNTGVAKAAVRVAQGWEKRWRSGKAKNKRKPPQRKGKEMVECRIEDDGHELFGDERLEEIMEEDMETETDEGADAESRGKEEEQEGDEGEDEDIDECSSEPIII